MAVLKRDRHLSHDVLFDYLDGALNRRERMEVERHLKSCAACRQLERKGKAVLAIVDDWPAGKVGRRAGTAGRSAKKESGKGS